MRRIAEMSEGAIDAGIAGRAAPATDWRLVACVVLAGIAAAVQVGKAAIAIPLLQGETGLTLAVLGWVGSVFAILGLFGGVPIGALATRFGDRRILLLGLVLLALGSVAGAGAPGFGLLLAGRVVEGVGFMMVSVSGPALLRRCVGEGDREVAIALWSCFMPTGMALAMLAGPLFGGWRAIWLAGAVLSLLCTVAVRLWVPAGSTGVSAPWRRLAADAGSVFLSRGPVLLALCFSLYAMMFFAVISFLPVLLIERMHGSLASAGALSGLATAGNILGNLAAGALLSRGVPRARLLAAASLTMGLAAVFALLPLLPPPGAFLCCIFFAMAGGLIPATLLSTAAILAPRPNLLPATIGLLMQGSNLGQVLGPVAAGSAIAVLGWSGVAGLVAILALLALAISGALRQDIGHVGRAAG